MPNSMLPSARSANNEPAMPIAAPAPVHRTAFASTMRAMAPEEAPSAIRTPISRMRRATRNAITPAAIAAWLPARQASAVDPMTALRSG